MATPAALGFRLHTGWVAVMAWGGPVDRPEFLERRRIELVDPAERDAAFVYHAAEDLPPAKAEAFLQRTAAQVEERARQALAELISALHARGRTVSGAAVPVGATTVPREIEAVLRSHTMVHAAEGQLYRLAIEHAAEAHDVPVTAVPA